MDVEHKPIIGPDIQPDIPAKKEKFLRQALERFDWGINSDHLNRDRAKEDIKFRDGDQWTPAAKSARTKEKRPMMTINKSETFIDSVYGQMLQTSPQIKVVPTDQRSNIVVEGENREGADGIKQRKSYKQNEVIDGLIRSIWQRDDGNRILNHATDGQVGHGFGWIRVVTKYVDDDILEMSPEAFHQDISLMEIADPFSVIPDPGATHITKKDMNFCFVSDFMRPDIFKQKYPNANHVPPADSSSLFSHWFEREKDSGDLTGLRVAEYFLKHEVKKTLYLLSDERVIDEEELIDELKEQGITVVQERVVITTEIEMYRITGNEVLEGPLRWLGKYIPLVKVSGKTLRVEGKEINRGVMRHTKDPQRVYNYWVTSLTENVANQNREPWLLTPDQIQGQEDKWDPQSPHNYRLYNWKQGQPVPFRDPPPQIPSGIVSALQIADGDMNTTAGRFPPSLGQPSGESSGKAIVARQRQGDVGSLGYGENRAASVRQLGYILVDLIPRIFDSQRVVRIVNEDESDDQVMLHETILDEETGEYKNLVDLRLGRYIVTVKSGQSFSNQRIEATEFMLSLIQAVPQIGPFILHLMAQYLDLPKADEVAKQLRFFAKKVGALESEQPQGGQGGEQPPADPLEAIKAEADLAISESKVAAAETNETRAKVDLLKTLMAGLEEGVLTKDQVSAMLSSQIERQKVKQVPQ